MTRRLQHRRRRSPRPRPVSGGVLIWSDVRVALTTAAAADQLVVGGVLLLRLAVLVVCGRHGQGGQGGQGGSEARAAGEVIRRLSPQTKKERHVAGNNPPPEPACRHQLNRLLPRRRSLSSRSFCRKCSVRRRVDRHRRTSGHGVCHREERQWWTRPALYAVAHAPAGHRDRPCREGTGGGGGDGGR